MKIVFLIIIRKKTFLSYKIKYKMVNSSYAYKYTRKEMIEGTKLCVNIITFNLSFS